MENNLSSDNNDIREWSIRVFITMFQRQNDATFIEPILKRSVLEKLRSLLYEDK